MSAGKGDKPRPVNKARYDVNFTAINWKSRSSAKSVEHCTRNSAATGTLDTNKSQQAEASDQACRRIR